MVFNKGGTIYRYDWYRILFSPSIYRIEGVDLISPYRKCVICVVHKSFHVWFMTASKRNLGSMKVTSSRATQTDWLLYRGLISAIMLDFTFLVMGLSFSFDAHTIVYGHTEWYNGWYRWAAIIHDTKNAIFQWFEEVYDCVCQTPNHYEFLSIYRQANGRYINMKTDLDMPPLVFKASFVHIV